MKADQFYSEFHGEEQYGFTPIKMDFILGCIGEGKKVLDVGCGDGTLGIKLIEQNNTVYGCDIAEASLASAQKGGLITKFVDLEKEELPYPKNSFDYVILGDVIEHMMDTDELLQKCYKVLKPGGHIIITTPNLASLARRAMLLLGISPYVEYSLFLDTNGLPSVGHIRYFTVSTLERLLKANKFKSIKIKADGLKLPFLPRITFFGNAMPSICTMLYAVAQK